MLVGAVRRLTVGGGDPVVQLQTNFGGGKTHSMLALVSPVFRHCADRACRASTR
jgi:predicted AAA+ superfamily ATPase